MARRVVGITLAVWSFGFAIIHLAWAVGWRGGVPTDQPPISTRPFFLAYDLAAAGGMIAAAVGALMLAVGRPRRGLIIITVVAAVLALLRGIPGLIMDAITREITVVGLGADVWFVVAGLSGLVLARMAHRAGRGARPMVHR